MEEQNQQRGQVSPAMQEYIKERKNNQEQSKAEKPGIVIPEGVSPEMRELLIDRHNKK